MRPSLKACPSIRSMTLAARSMLRLMSINIETSHENTSAISSSGTSSRLEIRDLHQLLGELDAAQTT